MECAGGSSVPAGHAATPPLCSPAPAAPPGHARCLIQPCSEPLSHPHTAGGCRWTLQVKPSPSRSLAVTLARSCALSRSLSLSLSLSRWFCSVHSYNPYLFLLVHIDRFSDSSSLPFTRRVKCLIKIGINSSEGERAKDGGYIYSSGVVQKSFGFDVRVRSEEPRCEVWINR